MYVTSDIIVTLMAINLICAIIYFYVRDNEDWADIPVWASLGATMAALLVATAILGEFVTSPSDGHVVYLGLGLAYIVDLIIMGAFFLIDGCRLLYSSVVNLINYYFPGAI